MNRAAARTCIYTYLYNIRSRNPLCIGASTRGIYAVRFTITTLCMQTSASGEREKEQSFYGVSITACPSSIATIFPVVFSFASLTAVYFSRAVITVARMLFVYFSNAPPDERIFCSEIVFFNFLIFSLLFYNFYKRSRLFKNIQSAYDNYLLR